MENPIASGKDVRNTLRARNLYRVVLINGSAQGEFAAIEGPLVLEAKDGSYKREIPLAEAQVEGDHLVFDFIVNDRRKKYRCYLKDDPLHIEIGSLPVGLGDPSGNSSPQPG